MTRQKNGYVLREYGSWSVLTVAFIAGSAVSRSFSWGLVPLFLSLALLVNSKQALMKWLRRASDQTSLVIFLGQAAVAGTVLVFIFRNEMFLLLPLLVFPVAYLISVKLAGEHFVVTELLGFVLLSLSAVLSKFLLTGGVDVRLFLGVALYFTAGVFKIKTLLLRKTTDRIFGVLYLILTLYVYHRMYIPYIILLPLIDNLAVALYPYRVKLRTTGWIEVTKSILFLILLIAYY